MWRNSTCATGAGHTSRNRNNGGGGTGSDGGNSGSGCRCIRTRRNRKTVGRADDKNRTRLGGGDCGGRTIGTIVD
eukprot:843631-Pyramimonas_sp.AAC.1